MMKEIPLSTSGVKFKDKYVALVDDEDYKTLMKHSWFVKIGKRGFTIYAQAKIQQKTVLMHRMILSNVKGIIDHRDCNGLNNQKYNLREVSYTVNNQNRLQPSGNTKFQGVYFEKRRNSFRSRIVKNGKAYHLGNHKSDIEAAEAYNKKALELYGPNARLNRVEI